MDTLGIVTSLLILAVPLAMLIAWAVSFIEVINLSDSQCKAADVDKLLWALLILFLPIIGSMLWVLVARWRVVAIKAEAEASPLQVMVHTTPPGWYPDSGTGMLRWWDGRQWTEACRAP